jgi:hypothetical protein
MSNMHYIDKLKKQLKVEPENAKLILEHECYELIQSAVELLVKDEKKVTIKAVVKLSKCDPLIVKKLLPEFNRVKTMRQQVRCTVVEKLSWENKAFKANLSLSDFVSSAMTKSIVIIPKVNVLQTNMNRLIGESIKQNVLLNNLIIWAEKNREPSEQLQILIRLESIENRFSDMIRRIKLSVSDAELNRYTGLNTAYIDHTEE